MKVLIAVSLGELFDKLTILNIKAHKLTGVPLEHVKAEQHELQSAWEVSIALHDHATLTKLADLCAALLDINQKLWNVEDEIREHERRCCFDDKFITLARSVYWFNDERSKVKREINELLGSSIVEEKSYTKY